MKAVSYMRCSGLGQTTGDTWDRQRDAIQAFAGSRDYTVEQEFREEAVPGKYDSEKRPAFQEMVATLLANGCRTVIVERLDRLAREYRIQEQLIMYLASKEITIISADTQENVTEAMMGDPMRRALVQIQGIFSELEKNMLVAKLAKARKRMRDRGERVEGRKPYGSRPGEKEIISIMKSLREITGLTYAEIAVSLNAAEKFSRSGGKWYKNSVRRILQRSA